MLSFRPCGICERCATVQTEIRILSLLIVSFPIPNAGLMKTSHTFGLMVFQNGVASTGNITIAKILLYRLVQNGLSLVFGTIDLVCFVRTRVAFMDALLNQGLTGWHSGMCRKDKMRGWSNFPIVVRQSENTLWFVPLEQTTQIFRVCLDNRKIKR